jgi:hypothetical protein
MFSSADDGLPLHSFRVPLQDLANLALCLFVQPQSMA